MLLYFGIMFMILWFVILFSYIHIKFIYSRKDENDKIEYEVKAFLGIIQLRFEVPVIKFKGFDKGVEVKSDLNLDNLETELMDTKEKITANKIIDFYHHIKALIDHISGFSEWLFLALSKIKCTQLQWYTNFGIGDAPITAVTIGIIWGIKTNLLGFVFKHIDLQTIPHIHVNPQFNRMYFSTELISKIKIRHFHAFLTLVHLLIRIIKVKGGLKVWASTLYEVYLSWKNKKKAKESRVS